MTKKIKITESDLVTMIQKIVKEDDLGGMTSNPNIMAKEYGDRYTKDSEDGATYDRDELEDQEEVTQEEVIKVLWQIQKLLSEGAPAIALRRVAELLRKMGEDVEFSHGILPAYDN
tara:strand:+ start:62 stop:409 length:348 start_codon:yes stop_codon:yes gene_type:complete